MADYDSSLPVRTENNGDVVAKIVDGTLTSQALAIDAAGKVGVKLDDAAGNGITSQVNGAQRALDVGIDVAGVQIDPRDIRALTDADVVTVEQGTAAAISGAWPVQPTDGTNSQAYTAAGEAEVIVTSALPAGSNTIGNVNIQTSGTALTSQASGAQQALDVGINVAGVQVDPRDIRALTASDVVTSQLQDGAGNDITSGVQGAARALDVELQINGAVASTANPIPVTVSSVVPGTEVLAYKTAAALAAGASDTHTYTVTGGSTLRLHQISASASGKIKVVIAIAGSTKVVKFNSTANPNIDHEFFAPQNVAAAATVTVTITNLDKQSMDVYSTIEGVEQ